MAETRSLQLRVRLASTERARQPATSAGLTWPGHLERLIAALTLFLLAFDLPQTWLNNSDDRVGVNLNAGGDIKTLALFLLLYLVCFTRLLNNGNLVLHVLRYDRTLFAFLGWIMLSTVWSVDLGVTGRRSGALVLTTLFGVFLVIRFSLREVLGIAIVVFGIGTVVSYALIFGLPDSGISKAGWVGMYEIKNQLGRHEALASMLYVVGISTFRRWRVPLIVLAGASIGLVIGSTSATSLVGLVAVLTNYFVFRLFRTRTTLFGAVAVSLTTTGGLAVLVALGNLKTLTGLVAKDSTFTGRTELWAHVWGTIPERAWLGWGWDAYWTGFFGPSHELWVAMPWLPPHSHNAILDYLLVIGVPGTVLFLVMFVRAVVRSTRFIRYRRDSLGLFPIMMVTYAFVFSLTEGGVVGRSERWALMVVALLTVGHAENAESLEIHEPEKAADRGENLIESFIR